MAAAAVWNSEVVVDSRRSTRALSGQTRNDDRELRFEARPDVVSGRQLAASERRRRTRNFFELRMGTSLDQFVSAGPATPKRR
ncbi:hypothetical protein P3T76_015020 [Phytophthora citrophthora]|uniref:Uncharacterized protein n=1 Tax=Phytophthora citrophthora TaxID=4793 RepID=A0AAD9LBE5_9STRA|nr:hypothetical protein P3T76_015020 [Phytophthora citrophthora]